MGRGNLCDHDHLVSVMGVLKCSRCGTITGYTNRETATESQARIDRQVRLDRKKRYYKKRNKQRRYRK